MGTGKFNSFIENLKKNHHSNRNRGVYGYMWWTAGKIVLIYLVTFVPLILIAKHFINFNSVFKFITDNLSDPFVLVVFTISESFLGMIPPDIFVIWSGKFDTPFRLLFILGILSYTGGIFSYYLGSWLSKRPKIKAYSERALDKYIKMVRKWGGAFIIIAALFPYSPYSTVVIAVSLLKYPLRNYLLFGISRILRFIIQGLFYLKLMNMDSFFG